MKYFDLHCDTITKLYDNSGRLYSNNCAISLDQREAFEEWTQVFAIWIPRHLSGKDAFNYYYNVKEKFFEEIKANQKYIQLFNSNSENDKNVRAILAVEGGSCLAGDINNLNILFEDGVKILTLMWNHESELGYAIEENNALKPFGKQVCKRMQELSMVIDVSHLPEKGFYDVAETVDCAFIASHSNAKKVCNHIRNLSNDQIKILVDRKGLIGLNFYKSFVSDKHLHTPDISDLLKHIDHFLEQGAQDILCMGSDFDGCMTVKNISRVKDVVNLYEMMLKKNYSEDIINKIFFENANNFFKK